MMRMTRERIVGKKLHYKMTKIPSKLFFIVHDICVSKNLRHFTLYFENYVKFSYIL